MASTGPARRALLSGGLYPIVDVALCEARGVDPLAIAEAFFAGGATLIQLRDKRPSSRARLALADAVVARAHAAGACLVLNDRADLARLSGADGVHVGQDDLPVAAVRRILGPRATVGVSTHSPDQIDEAAGTTASYIAVGPIFTTSTKDTGYSARGLDLVRRAAATPLPVVAIGGITLERLPEVLHAGASAVAVISDLLPGDVAGRVRTYLERLAAIHASPDAGPP